MISCVTTSALTDVVGVSRSSRSAAASSAAGKEKPIRHAATRALANDEQVFENISDPSLNDGALPGHTPPVSSGLPAGKVIQATNRRGQTPYTQADHRGLPQPERRSVLGGLKRRKTAS